MTAIRVVTDHGELDNVGSVGHTQIDSYVNNSPWLLVSGVSGPVPPSARKLVAGSNILIVDSGPGGNLTISSTGGGSGGSSTTRTMWMEALSGSVDGVNTDFTLSNAPFPSSTLMLFINGLLMQQGLSSDYVMSSSTVVSLLGSYTSGSNITATYPYVLTGSAQLISWMELPTGDVDGVNTDFVLANVPSPLSSLMFYVNGVLLKQGTGSDYVMVSANTIRMNYGYRSGSNVFATYPY